MTTTTHQHDQNDTSTGSTARLELRPAGYEVGDQVRIDLGAIPPAWVPPGGVRLTELRDLVGTVVEAHRCDDAEDALPGAVRGAGPGVALLPVHCRGAHPCVTGLPTGTDASLLRGGQPLPDLRMHVRLDR